MKLDKKRQLLQKRRWRIRKKVSGTAERPRLTVHFSNKHIYAQCIDDTEGKTLVYASSIDSALKDQNLRATVDGASVLGKAIGEKAKSAGIEKIVFDRGGRLYHGCVKAFAESAREAGLQF